MALGVAEFTELVSTTLQEFKKDDLVDQVMTKQPTLDLLKANTKSGSGREFVINLVGAENDKSEWSDASGTFDTSPDPEFIGGMKYEWSVPLITPVRIRHTTLEKNKGSSTQLYDLLKRHVKWAMDGHAKTLGNSLHATPAAYDALVTAGNTPPVPWTLALNDTAGDADPAGDSSIAEFNYAGIDSGDHAYWQAVVKDDSSRASTGVLKAFRSFERDIDDAGGDTELTHILAGRNVYEEYEDAMEDKVRYVLTGNSEVDAQTRFKDIYHGNLIIRYDRQVPADSAYFLALPTWHFRYLNDEFMQSQPAQQIPGTLDMVQPIASIVSWGCEERRANGVLTRVA